MENKNNLEKEIEIMTSEVSFKELEELEEVVFASSSAGNTSCCNGSK
jgi:hypothetical protein